MPRLGRVLVMAALPVMKILVMCGIGALLASPKINAFPPDARKHLNKLVVLVFAPCLIFTKLAETVTAEKLIEWWYMPLNVLLSFAIGACVGLVVVKLTRPPHHLENLTIACCSAGNTGNVPLVLISSICEVDDNPFGANLSCSLNGQAYVSFGMWMATLLIWTFIYTLLMPNKFNNQHLSSKDVKRVQFQTPNANDIRLIKTSNKMDEENTERSSLPMNTTPSLASLQSIGTKISTTLNFQQIFTPPTTAAFLALIVGGCVPLKSIFIGSHAPLHFLTDCFAILGDATIPCMNLILGGNLISGIHGSGLQPKTTIGILCTRFFILPLIGCGLVFIVINLKLIPDDPLFHFVLLLQFCMPTAINIGTIAQLHENGELETSMILFWSYTSSVVFLTVWIIFFLAKV
ncbi:protein PIN-LIKES 3 isoform X2 [Physcomitrium patens]|uniref:protein PIN-LIKES 3 isoform X2 n=1 Tax=Physcomitrium patens TaxID=3218 RepID=UPI000D167322|nr:protein PIN-LIKES 3-like [Physcomitrium patens]XP_024380043.1 protein PIN-LIKES 3-like [Physcomitrium patens]|eukprot:XP_024380042.1 protein PIN-LIKES 3-like [Physcomitrella patens]